MSKRKHFTPEQKVAIVRRHLLEGVPVSDLCDELGIHATQYYNWQKQLFENAAPAFERRPNKANQRRQEAAAERKIAELEAKLQKKNVDLEKTPITLGPMLLMDPAKEVFTNHDGANKMLTREYRNPFVVPAENEI